MSAASSFGLYDFLSQIKQKDWVEYAALFLFVLVLVVWVIRPTTLHVIGVIIASIVVYYRIDKKHTTIEDTYTELEYRLKELTPKPENFHMDADLINLFYNIKEFRGYHSEGYDSALVAVDNMLKIKSEIEAGVYHCKDNLDIMREQHDKAMNHFHTIVFKLPIQLDMQRKYKRAMNALHVLLRRHIDDASHLCKKYYKDRPMDIDYHPVYNSGPRPDDTQNDENTSEASTRFAFFY